MFTKESEEKKKLKNEWVKRVYKIYYLKSSVSCGIALAIPNAAAEAKAPVIVISRALFHGLYPTTFPLTKPKINRAARVTIIETYRASMALGIKTYGIRGMIPPPR
jgi:hypothetical protein